MAPLCFCCLCADAQRLTGCWLSEEINTARCFAVDSIFNDLLSGYLVSHSQWKKENHDSYTDSVTKEEETQTETVALMTPLMCSSISKHLRRVLHTTVLHHQFFSQHLMAQSCQFESSGLQINLLQNAEDCFYIALLKQVMISLANSICLLFKVVTSVSLSAQISLLKQSLELQLSQSQSALQQLQSQFNQERELLSQQMKG